MKTHLKLIAGITALGAAISSVSAQQNFTKPVGFRTETIKAGVFNLISDELTNKVSAAGTLTAVAGTALTDDAADFATSLAGTGTWVLQVTSGDKSGLVTEITGTTATGLTTADDLGAAGVASGASYEVRAAKTLAQIFGAANEAGLTTAASDAASDLVWIPDGAGGFVRYFYKTGGLGGNGWRQVGNLTTDRSATPIVYTDAFFIQSRAAADKDLVLVGHVPTQGATVPLISGFNFVTRRAPVGQTLDTSGLATSLGTGPSDAASDLVWNPDGAGGYVRYFNKTGGLGGNGWRAVGNLTQDQKDTPLSSGIIVQRKGAATNAKIGVPAFYANL